MSQPSMVSMASSTSNTLPNDRRSGAASPRAPPGRSTSSPQLGRIESILETGRQRADSMASPPERQPSMSYERIPEEAVAVDEPNETTGIVSGATSRQDYQSTQTQTTSSKSILRNRNRRPARVEPDHANAATANSNGNDSAPDADDEKTHWFLDYLSGIWSIELENKGSVARDHLALERTFLAWLRTSLAFASIGIAVTQLFRLNTTLSSSDHDHSVLIQLGQPLGTTFIGISILVLLLGYHRYYQSQQWVLKGKFPASRGTVILVSLVAFALMVISLIVVVVLQPPDG